MELVELIKDRRDCFKNIGNVKQGGIVKNFPLCRIPDELVGDNNCFLEIIKYQQGVNAESVNKVLKDGCKVEEGESMDFMKIYNEIKDVIEKEKDTFSICLENKVIKQKGNGKWLYVDINLDKTNIELGKSYSYELLLGNIIALPVLSSRFYFILISL